MFVTLRQGLSSSSPLPSSMYRTDVLICPLKKSLILFIFNIIIKGPLLPGLAIKIDAMGNADMIVLQMLSERFAYIIKSVNEDDEESAYYQLRVRYIAALILVPLFFDISVLRLLKDGADPHTLVSSGGSLLHLVRVIED